MKTARLIISDSEKNANLYYATRFLAPDSFIFLEVDGRRLIVMSDLEIDRAKSQANVDEIISYTELTQKAQANGSGPTYYDVLDVFLKDHSIQSLQVPSNFSLLYADGLRSKGYIVEAMQDPFFQQRIIKSDEEITHLTQTLRVTEDALAMAIELIKNAIVESEGTLSLGGKPLTVELIRKAMHLTMMERDCIAQHTIIAPGVQAVDPHNEGSGVLRANEPIVMDVFPQHAITRYFADLSRTVVKGKASDKIKRMFNAVKDGQEIAYSMIKDGVDGSSIHKAIVKEFEGRGFKTGTQDGRMQGFFHGTGHGVGLEIHEPPRISPKSDILKAGMVVTVEPGLYYMDAGGMRIEDMAVVTKDGCRVLTESPKVLEV